METNLPSPMTARVKLLIYQRVIMVVIMVIIVNNGFFPYGNNGNDYG
jgi:hypothetical protein